MQICKVPVLETNYNRWWKVNMECKRSWNKQNEPLLSLLKASLYSDMVHIRWFAGNPLQLASFWEPNQVLLPVNTAEGSNW